MKALFLILALMLKCDASVLHSADLSCLYPRQMSITSQLIHSIDSNISTDTDSAPSLTIINNLIENCGHQKSLVLAALVAMLNVIPLIERDLSLGLLSQHGFGPIFKDQSNQLRVRKLLQSMSLLRPLSGLKPWPSLRNQPHFACVNDQTTRLYPWGFGQIAIDPVAYCKDENIAAFYLTRSYYVFICPQFFGLPLQPRPGSTSCPSVVDNMFQGDDKAFLEYRIYLLIHELAHLYLRDYDLGDDTTPPEQYESNQCVSLDSTNSIRNPQNLQIYCACELKVTMFRAYLEH